MSAKSQAAVAEPSVTVTSAATGTTAEVSSAETGTSRQAVATGTLTVATLLSAVAWAIIKAMQSSTRERAALQGVSYEEAYANVGEATRLLFDAEPRVQSVGLARHDKGYGYRAVVKVNPDYAEQPVRLPGNVFGIPVTFEEDYDDVQLLTEVHYGRNGKPTTPSTVLEQRTHRTLFCGLQIQNFDNDSRRGALQGHKVSVGTLGCFVKSADGGVNLLSNNHVIAGLNSASVNTDRITQPGNLVFENHVATLQKFEPIKMCAPGAPYDESYANLTDAAIARMESGVPVKQGFLPHHKLPLPNHLKMGAPVQGDKVFKIGSKTGLTYGRIEATEEQVPIKNSGIWYAGTFRIKGHGGQMFSDHGDSGAVVMNSSGEVLGIIIAGTTKNSYACTMRETLKALKCTLF
jgi:hypothetical protein